MLRLTLSTLCIFSTWYLIGYLSGSTDYLSIWGILLPASWSILFIYFRSKGFAYHAILGYTIYLLMFLADELCFREAVLPRYGDKFIPFQLSYSLASVIYILGLNLTRTLLNDKKPAYILTFNSLVTLLTIIIPGSYITYRLGLNAEITRDVIFAIMASNQQESLEFALVYLSPQLLLFGAILVVMLISLIRLQTNKPNPPRIRPKLIIVQIAVLTALMALQPKDFRLYGFIYSSVRMYYAETGRFFETQRRYATEEGLIQSSKEERDETCIVVIGESLSPSHMGIYGYHRDTTPLLANHAKENDLLIFNHAFASHTHTVESLCLALTEANLQNEMKFFESPSILHILNHADIDTTWLSNQWLRDDFTNSISTIVMHADELNLLSNNQASQQDKRGYDGVIIEPALAKIAQAASNNQVIFIHLRGSHWDYKDRYPEAFNHFTGTNEVPRSNDWNQLSDEVREKVNHYDNSVAYNDFVISALIDGLIKQGGVSSLIYFSDHGEDVYGDLGHNSSQATLPMINIPLVMWFSPKYQQRYEDTFTTLAAHTNKLFCNDSIYDTLIGILALKTDRVDHRYDLSDQSYNLNLEDADTLYGRTKYASMLETTAE